MEEIYSLIINFIDNSSYSARILEVAMHSLFQVLSEEKVLFGELKPLTQMRSANKKHGNIGDIEVVNGIDSNYIIEAWDAKYGKSYLRDELEELAEKLKVHPETEVAGFVTNIKPDYRPEIINRIEEISELYGTKIKIFSFEEWVKVQTERTDIPKNILGQKWLLALVETLGQKRREIVPIDEPCDNWVTELKQLIEYEIH